MLEIRAEQMKALCEPTYRRLEGEVIRRVETESPEQIMELGEDGVRARARHGIEKALRYGIETEDDVVALMDLYVEYGADFEKRDGFVWTAGLLEDRNLVGTAKVDLIYAGLPD